MFVITAIMKSGYPYTESLRAFHDVRPADHYRRLADARFEEVIANKDVILATYILNGEDGPEIMNVYRNPEAL